MGERACIRECTHTDTGNPREAIAGSLLCGRCYSRLRSTLHEAPDLCAHLRSQVDPMKSGWNFDREKTGGRPASGSRPPMSDDLVDAADEVLAILTYFAELFGDEMEYRTHTFDAGTDAVGAYHRARMPAAYLLEHLPAIANDARVEGFARAVIDVPRDDEPNEEIQWTIAKALRRWSMHESSRWAKQPCPVCETHSVRIRPPRVFGEAPLFWCVNEECSFDPTGELHVWGEYFGLTWHEHRWVHLPEYPVGEYRCDCGESTDERGAAA